MMMWHLEAAALITAHSSGQLDVALVIMEHSSKQLEATGRTIMNGRQAVTEYIRPRLCSSSTVAALHQAVCSKADVVHVAQLDPSVCQSGQMFAGSSEIRDLADRRVCRDQNTVAAVVECSRLVVELAY